ncbi:MAG TPA: hypothetical protein VHG93_15590, partial [Longimicrobium sp.]|nr:hypothetical protein [Longimicrobium sp.]
MPPSWHFDWGTFWLLAAITLGEGLRRVPAGSVLLRHVTGYPWQVAAGPLRASAWRLASVFSPLALHLVVPAAGEARNDVRLRKGWIAILRIPALLALVALLAGVPLLSASMGTRGLIYAVIAVFGAALLAALLALAALRWMGAGWKAAAWDAFRILSPFTAPRAPEIVLERVMTGVPPADAIRVLLPADDFAAWIRPFAYDARVRGADDALVAREEAERILRAPPAGVAPGDVYCPRCGSTYLPGVETCHACEVPLERWAENEPAPPPAPPEPAPVPAGASRAGRGGRKSGGQRRG